uniref:Uncharacterized protein n=1 Tax=Rhizophora mucronata TaxID=61149 RepID=A0A2P2PNY9_RHIMU
MDDTQKSKEMKRGANRLAELAKKAVQENGSSSNDVKALIKDIRIYKSSKIQ